MNLDFWYNDKIQEVDRITIYFSDADSIYRGNMYKAGKIIGDFSSPDSVEIEKTFSQLTFNW